MRSIKRIVVFLVVTLAAQSGFALYTPQQALKDALSEPLMFVGSFIPSSSESGLYPECVFKNSKVMVISSYCVKKAVPAARLLILSNQNNQGYARLYAEINGGVDISLATRFQYIDFMFSPSVIVSKQPFDIEMSSEKIQKWQEREEVSFDTFCVTGLSLKDLPYSTHCKNIQSDTSDWAKAGFNFWKNSDPNFKTLLQTIKRQVPFTEE